jgi:phosphonate transport system substrate-binding protein
LTPVFLNNDIDLLAKLKSYLSRQTGREVQLVQRRTYEEITALLLSGQLTAACFNIFSLR